MNYLIKQQTIDEIAASAIDVQTNTSPLTGSGIPSRIAEGSVFKYTDDVLQANDSGSLTLFHSGSFIPCMNINVNGIKNIALTGRLTIGRKKEATDTGAPYEKDKYIPTLKRLKSLYISNTVGFANSTSSSVGIRTPEESPFINISDKYNFQIYSEKDSKPSGWSEYYNVCGIADGVPVYATVHFGVTLDDWLDSIEQ